MSNKAMPLLNKNLNFKTITHGFFTRKGGFSNKNNSSLNCNFNTNDTILNIKNNRKLVCNYHKLNIENLKTVKQVHSNKVLTINNLEQKTNDIEADALVTNQPNLILGILTADCAPVLAFDPINKIIAAIHIGWKGAIKNILSNTIDTFIAMNANTQNIKLAIGPCIGPMSYEVKNDFYDNFLKINIKNKKYFTNLNSNKLRFNLPEYIHDEALNKGVLNKNISNLKRDTFIEKEMFFSFRRNYIKNIGDCGRMISTISINKKND